MEESLSDRQLFREAGDNALDKGLFKEAYDWYERADYKLGTRWVLKKSQEDLGLSHALAVDVFWKGYDEIKIPNYLIKILGKNKFKSELGKFCAN